MLVHEAPLAVRVPAEDAAELQARARERLAETHVEGHVAVVRVHVEAQVRALLILHQKAVMAVQCTPALFRKQRLGDRRQHPSDKRVHRALHPDLVHD